MQRPSYAVCASLLAIVCASTATAVAAIKPTITGAHVKNSTLTTKDIKNRSLAYLDFNKRIGAPGDVGSQGQVGDTGRQGARGTTGADGEAGDAAERQFSFSYRDAGARFSTITNPNSGSAPWYMRSSISAFKSPEFLNTSGLIMTDLAQSQQSGGVLNLPRASVVIVTSTISLLHRGDARCDDGSATMTMDSVTAACASPTDMTPDESDDVNVHTRVECWTEYANADGSSPARVGEGLFASGWATERLVNLPLTAGISLPQGSYTFRTVCRMADRTSKQQHDDWEFVHANMSVLAAAQTGI